MEEKKPEKKRTFVFDDQELQDLRGSIKFVTKGLDVTQKDVLKRYIALFEKLEDAAN